MPSAKSVSVSFRVSPRFKVLLEAAAAREHRSQTNMLEKLLYAFCEQQGIEAEPATPAQREPTPGKPLAVGEGARAPEGSTSTEQ
jgi:hypothetical protein